MNKRMLSWVLAGCTAVMVQTAWAQPDSDHVKLTLAAWNVENFFDGYNDPYTDDDGMTPTPPEKLAKMAAVMREVNADFIGVVEMETEGALHKMVRENLADMGYGNNMFVSHRDFGRGINNGGISRVPIGKVSLYRFTKLTLPGEEKTWYFARDLVCFELLPAEGVKVEVFVVHLKSKRDSENDPKSAKWRLAEAQELRRIIGAKLSADPDAMIAVVGDFNDTPDSGTIQTLLAGAGSGGAMLVDVHADMPEDQRQTYLREPYIATIDYIMVSPALAACVQPGSAKVFADDTVQATSDHAAVSAVFAIPVPAVVP